MSATPWTKWYAGDFLNGVSDLTPNEGWAYTIILNLIYDAQAPIRFDVERLARRCRMRPTALDAAVNSLVNIGKLTLTDGLLSNRRAEKSIETRAKLVANSSEAANARWKKEDELPQQNQRYEDAPALLMHCETDAYQKPEARSQKERDKSLSGRDEGFDLFWAAYPKKVGKPQAAKSFAKAIKRTDIRTLLDGLDRAKASPDWTKSAGQFIPHPTTWLNRDGWADALAADPSTAPLDAGAVRGPSGYVYKPDAWI